MHRIERRRPPEAIAYVAGSAAGGALFALLWLAEGGFLFFLVAAVFGVVAGGLHHYFGQHRVPTVVECEATEQTRFTETALDDLRGLGRRVRRSPTAVGERCSEIVDYYDELENPPRHGETARAWACSLLASVHRLQGRSKSAESLLERVNGAENVSEDERQAFVLQHYLTTGEASQRSVACFARTLKRPKGLPEKTVRRVATRLREMCAVDDSMSKADLKDRIKWNRAAAEAMPETAWPIVNEATAFFHLGRHDRAEALLAAAPRDSESWRGVALQARLDRARGRTDEARRRLEAIVRGMQSGSTIPLEAILEVAGQLHELGSNDDAEKVLGFCGDEPEAISRTLFLKGRWRLAEGDTDAARELFTVAVQRDPGNTKAGLLLAEMCRRGGDSDEAERVLGGLAKHNPDDADVHFARAAVLWNAGRWTEAAEAFETCAFLRVGDGRIAYRWARCLLADGRYAEAGQLLDEARIDDGEIVADAAFYHGVAWMRASDACIGPERIASLERAWPHFVRANDLYRKGGNRKASLRAKANLLTCYQFLAEALVAAKEYLRAAKTYEVIARNGARESELVENARYNAGESFFRVGLGAVRRGRDREAVQRLREAGRYRRSNRLRMLRGGVLARMGKYEEALSTYEKCLAAKPGDETTLFALALVRSRLPGRDANRAELQSIADGEGDFFLRAALGLADLAAKAGDHESAATILEAAITRPAASKNRSYKEAAGKAALFAAKAGRSRQAASIVTEHLGADGSGKSEVLIGALLADVEEFDDALPHLASAIDDGEAAYPVVSLYESVVRRVAAARCESDDFAGARTVLAAAVERRNGASSTYGLRGTWEKSSNGDDELGRYFKLVGAVHQRSGASVAGLDGGTFDLLEEMLQSSKRADPSVARPLIVGMFRRATELATDDFAEARRLWTRARTLWKKSAAKSKSFWKSYVEAYNVGKTYELETEGRELRDRIESQLADYCILAFDGALRGRARASLVSQGPDLEIARYFWTEIRELVGEKAAEKLFDERIDVDEIVNGLRPNENVDEACTVLEFLNEVRPKEQFETILSNLGFNVAVRAITNQNIARFKEGMTYAARAGGEIVTVASNVRKLPDSVIRAALRCLDQIPDVATLRLQNRDAYGQLATHIVIIYANTHEAQFGGISADQVPPSFPQVLQMAMSQMTG